MKKLLILPAIIAAFSFVSCGKKTESSSEITPMEICAYASKDIKKEMAKGIGSALWVAFSQELGTTQHAIGKNKKDIEYIADNIKSKVTKAVSDKNRKDIAYCTMVMRLDSNTIATLPSIKGLAAAFGKDPSELTKGLKNESMYYVVDYTAVYQGNGVSTLKKVNDAKEIDKSTYEQLVK
jgi:hypothetical protein